MNTIEKRDYIHNYLHRIDDKTIDEMYKKVHAPIENEISLTQVQEEEILYRVARHKNKESKLYTWAEVKSNARNR